MNWDEITLYSPDDLLTYDKELLMQIGDYYRHEEVKNIIAERITYRFSHLDDPLSLIDDVSLLKNSGVLLNLALVMRENSTRRGDIFYLKAIYYETKFERELQRALSVIAEKISKGPELVR